MELQFSSLMEGAHSTILSACNNASGGCDSSGCDNCQSGCEGGTEGCDGT